MTISNRGYTKLVEECGELIQVAAKRIAYLDDSHPDDRTKPSLDLRIEDEIADVLAACRFVIEKNKLNTQYIEGKMNLKVSVFNHWDKEDA